MARPDGGARLKALWVAPAHRGHGYGRALRDHRIAIARAEGARYVEAYAVRPDAYVRIGWAVVREVGRGVAVVRLALP